MGLGYAALIAAGLTVHSTAFGAIIAGPVTNPANIHTYYLLSQNTWTASETEAVALGGHLVTVNDAAENTWVVNAFGGFGGSGHDLWTGLNDATTEGVFAWTSGDAVTYTNWAPGEPSGTTAGDDYVFMYSLAQGPTSIIGKWNDFSNVSSGSLPGNPLALFGVVELVPEPAGLALVSLAVIACLRRRHRS